MARIERETVELVHPAGSRRTVLKDQRSLGADGKEIKGPNPEIEAMKCDGFMTVSDYKKLKDSDIADACAVPGVNPRMPAHDKPPVAAPPVAAAQNPKPE